jgi:membrane-associated protease RseP (regulator of RpoE activity)
MFKNRLARVGIAAVAVLAIVGGITFLVAAAGGSGSTSASSAALADESQSGSDSSSTAAQDEQANPWMGILLTQTSDGLTIGYVIADTPAEAAGLQRGDVIQAVDGTDVANVRDLRDQLADKAEGDTVTLTISRDDQVQDVAVTLEARPEALSRAIPLLPELEGIPSDELFGHILGGQFNLTDENGNPITVVLEVGTVASVDADNGTLTVDLNSGTTKTYTVEDSDLVCGGGLSSLAEGDNVTVMTVNDDVRAVLPGGGGLPFLPGLGGKHGGFGFRHGGLGADGGWEEGFGMGSGRFDNGGLGDGGFGGFTVPSTSASAASGTGL